MEIGLHVLIGLMRTESILFADGYLPYVIVKETFDDIATLKAKEELFRTYRLHSNRNMQRSGI